MIKLLVIDVDGTLTDGKYYVSNNGDTMKAFNTKDFDYLSKAQKSGIRVVLLTSSKDDCVWHKVQNLSKEDHNNLILFQGIKDKLSHLSNMIYRWGDIDWRNIAYMGDWDNDLKVMKRCSIIACPKDASEKVKNYVKNEHAQRKNWVDSYVSDFDGGDGAVADFVDFLLYNKT